MPDFTLAGFAAHLASLTVEIEHETHDALEEAAMIVQTEAKAEIGRYQDEAGPFAAWAELADSTKADRVSQGYTENDPLLRRGDLRDSIEHTVTGHVAHIGSDSPIAEYQELGTQKIPPRSFLGGAAFRKGHEVAEIIGSRYAAVLTGHAVQGGPVPIERSAGDLAPGEGG